MEGGLVGVAALQIAWRFLAVGTPPTSPLVVFVVGSASLCLWRLSGIALLLLCLLCLLLPWITEKEKKHCWKHFFLLRSENEGGGANAGSSLALGVLLVPFMLAAKLWLVQGSSYDVAFFLYYLWEGMCCGLCALLLSCWVGMFGKGRHGSTRSSLRAVTALFCVLPAPILSLLISFLFPETSFLLNFGTQCLFVMSLTTSLHYLPRCFTFAEATILASAFTLFTSDAFIYTLSRFASSSFLVAPFLSVNRDPIQLFLFALIVGMMICGLFVVLFLRSYLPLPPFPSPASTNVKENHAKSASAAPSSLIHRKPKRKEKGLGEHKEKQPGLFSLFSDSGWFVSLAFYCIIVAVVLSLIYPWLHLMLNDNPFLWTIEWLLSDDRVFALCVYWASVLVVSLLLIAFLDARFRDAVPKIIVRKYYHLLTIVMFVPGIFYQMDFLRLAFGVALSALLLIEYIRKAHIRPFGSYIHQFMHSFIDSRDLGFFFLTHIHLLLGCAIPVWFFSSSLSYPPPLTSFYRLLPFVGVLIVGIGDSLASLVGRCFGSCKWPRTKKTVEGTASAVVGVLLCSAVLLWWMGVSLFDFYQWRGLVWATTSACLLEAFTLQIDNLVLPMYFFSVLVFSL